MQIFYQDPAPTTRYARYNFGGFTLVELSIVIVVIGLIAGGIIIGKDLINSAQIRSQVSQMEGMEAAVNTFKLKYGYLPGDIPTAAAYGFSARGIYPGQGDGNGLIEGALNHADPGGSWGLLVMGGETGIFWRDLTSANLLEGGANMRSSITCSPGCSGGAFTGNFSDYLPAAKIGKGNYIYVYSINTKNYYGLSITTAFLPSSQITSSPGLTPIQAQSIDAKLDDGLPQSGRITARYLNAASVVNAANAASPNATTCYDTTSGTYSVGGASIDSLNCALSFLIK